MIFREVSYTWFLHAWQGNVTVASSGYLHLYFCDLYCYKHMVSSCGARECDLHLLGIFTCIFVIYMYTVNANFPELCVVAWWRIRADP